MTPVLTALLIRIAARDNAAMTELWRLTHAPLSRYVGRIIRDESHAEEVVQDTYAQAWAQAVNFDPVRGTPMSWLYTIARSRSLDAFRKSRKLKAETALEDYTNLTSQGSPEEVLEQGRIHHRLQNAVRALPARQRESVDLAFYEGYTHSEIANLTGVPLGTVKTRIRTALTKIGESFAEHLPMAA